jgi:hypothetical protein
MSARHSLSQIGAALQSNDGRSWEAPFRCFSLFGNEIHTGDSPLTYETVVPNYLNSSVNVVKIAKKSINY